MKTKEDSSSTPDYGVHHPLVFDEDGSLRATGPVTLDGCLLELSLRVRSLVDKIRMLGRPDGSDIVASSNQSIKLVWQEVVLIASFIQTVFGFEAVAWDPPKHPEACFGKMITGRGQTTFPAEIADILRETTFAILSHNIESKRYPAQKVEQLSTIANGLMVLAPRYAQWNLKRPVTDTASDSPRIRAREEAFRSMRTIRAPHADNREDVPARPEQAKRELIWKICDGVLSVGDSLSGVVATCKEGTAGYALMTALRFISFIYDKSIPWHPDVARAVDAVCANRSRPSDEDRSDEEEKSSRRLGASIAYEPDNDGNAGHGIERGAKGPRSYFRCEPQKAQAQLSALLRKVRRTAAGQEWHDYWVHDAKGQVRFGHPLGS